MKKRMTVALAVLVLLVVASVPVAYNLNLMLSRQGGFCWNPIRIFPQVIRQPTTLKLMLMFWGLSVLAVLACLLSGSQYSTRTGMQHITPDIEIPVAAGQGQYGTARFLDKRKYAKAFRRYALRDAGEIYDQLLKEGKHDQKEIDAAPAADD